MRRFSFIFLFLIVRHIAFCQFDDTASGQALYFDGVDDYVSLGNVYDDLALPVTMSAWINVANETNYFFPILHTQDNTPYYNGAMFSVRRDLVSVSYGDGKGQNNSAFYHGKSVTVPNMSGRWMHVAVVMRGRNDMQIFVNGYDVGGNFQGNTMLPMSSNHPADDAKIGYWLSNGITSRFKGLMDELRIFNRALTTTEIRDQMCRKLSGNEAGLIGYWTFDETSGNTLFDKSPNQFHGVIHGNPARVYSGAPIGDESIHLYTTNWTNEDLSLDGLTVTDVSGNPMGMHVYKVNATPSQTGGLDEPAHEYYGVYAASLETGTQFNYHWGSDFCSLAFRADNSTPVWDNLTEQTIADRFEVISNGVSVQQDLGIGENIVVCNEQAYVIRPNVETDGMTLEWNTGATTKDISVTQPGQYIFTMYGTCTVASDTFNITFPIAPQNFSLGNDKTWCSSHELSPLSGDRSFNYLWHDGSMEPTYTVTGPGEVWVEINSECGSAIDTVEYFSFTSVTPPNIITPNDDNLNEAFVIGTTLEGSTLFVYNRWGQLVFSSENYHNDWRGAGLPTGVYFYTLSNDCIGQKKGTVTITR